MPREIPARAWLLVLLGLASCEERGGATGHRFESVASATASTRPSQPSLYTRAALQTLLGEIEQRVGETASVLMVELTAERATIQVEAPTRPGQVVQYEWGGGEMRGPVPVELRGTGSLDSNLFPLSSVDFNQIPELTQAAIERVDREHGEVRRIVVRRNLPIDEAVGIRVYVDSPIRSSHVDADARGKLAESPRIP